jgi:hypothetical protein
MCPACISTLAMLLAGAVSSGGVTALVVGKFRVMSGIGGAKSSVEKANQEEETCQKQRTSK